MHSLRQWFLSDFIPAFSRTLLHSLWQGAAAAILAGIVIATTRKASAVKRYNGLVMVYALFLLTVAVTFFYETGAPVAAVNRSFTSAVPPSAVVITENGTTTATVVHESFGSRLLSLANRNAVLLVGLWALLFSAQLTRIAFGLRYVQTVRRKGTQPVPEEWAGWIKKAGDQLGIRQVVLLLQSERVKVPVALGFLKPVVLVPVGLLTQLSPQQVEAILLHELAHIRRRDYPVNLVQIFADAVFFFNPAVRWISARIREERETCCDGMVVQHTADKKGYVEALVSFSRLPLSPAYAMALGSNKTHLLNRVKTIITRENSRLTVREQAILLLGMVVMMAFGALAFKPEEKEIIKAAASQKKPLPAAKRNTPALNIPAAVQPDRSKKTVSYLPPRQRIDTPPPSVIKRMEPIKWKSMSTNINDDGTGKTTQVIATEENGTVYRLRKTGDEMVFLSVDGREIAKEKYPQYYSVIDAIEQAGKRRAADALKAREVRATALRYQQQALQQKREELQQQRMKLDLQRQAVRFDSLRRLSYLNRYEPRKEGLYTPYKPTPATNSTLTAIIADLVSAKLVDSETKLSFSLNAAEMVINGKVADKELAEKFRKKYLKNAGDSFRYFKDGGTTRTEISLE